MACALARNNWSEKGELSTGFYVAPEGLLSGLIFQVANYKVAKDEQVIVVEYDFNGLVGMPYSKVNGVKLTGETVTKFEQSLEAPDAIDAGLFNVDQSFFSMIEEALAGAAYVRTVDVLAQIGRASCRERV